MRSTRGGDMPPRYATDIDAVLDALTSEDEAPEARAGRDIQDVLGLLRAEDAEAARTPKPAPAPEPIPAVATAAAPTPAPPVAPQAPRIPDLPPGELAGFDQPLPGAGAPAPRSRIAEAGVPVGPGPRENVGQVYRDLWLRTQREGSTFERFVLGGGGIVGDPVMTPKLAEEVGGPMAAGAVGPLGGALQFMASNLDSPSLQQVANFVNQMAVDTMPEHPNFGQEVLAAGTSTAIFWMIGLGAMGGTAQLARLSPLLAKLTGGSAMVLAEAMGEAGPVAQEAYGKAIEKGLTPDQAMYEATAAANRAFVGNSVWLAATQKLGGPLEAGGTTALGTIGKRAVAEGVQEGGQEAIDAAAQFEVPELGRVGKSAGIGAIVGGGFGAMEAGAQSRAVEAPAAPKVEPTEMGAPAAPPTAEPAELGPAAAPAEPGRQEPADLGEAAAPAEPGRAEPTEAGDVDAVLAALGAEPEVAPEERAPTPEKPQDAPGRAIAPPAEAPTVEQTERLPRPEPAPGAAPLWSTAPQAGRVIDALPDGTYRVRNAETGEIEAEGLRSLPQAAMARDRITSSLPGAEEEPGTVTRSAASATPLWSTAPHAGRVIDALPDGTYQVRNVETGQVEEGGIPSVSEATIVRDAITSSLLGAEEEPAPAAPPASLVQPSLPSPSGPRRPDAVLPPGYQPAKPIYEMGPDELEEVFQAANADEKQAVLGVFGPEKAKEYERLQKIANSTMRPFAETNAASEQIQAMEANLSEAQQQRLFGLGEAGPNADDIREFRSALGRVDDSSPEALGESLQWAVTQVGEQTDPATMTFTQQKAWAVIRYAMERAQANGFDLAAVSEAAFRHAAARFRDPEDAAFMLRRFVKPAAATSPPPPRVARSAATQAQEPGEAPGSVPLAAGAPENAEPESLPRNVSAAPEATHTGQDVRRRARRRAQLDEGLVISEDEGEALPREEEGLPIARGANARERAKREAAKQGPQAMLGGLATGQARPQGDPQSARRALARALHAIVQTMNEHGSQPFRTGRFRGAPNVLARFFPKTKMIQSVVAEDVEHIAHEYGHYIQLHVFGSLSGNIGFLRAHRAELLPIATKGTRGKPDSREGFAEFIRLYLTDPQEARAKAPQTYDDLEHLLELREPGLLADMQAFQSRYTGWVQMPVLERARMMVVYPEGFLRTPRWRDIQASLHRAYAFVKDDKHTLNRIQAEVEQLRGRTNAETDLRILGSVVRGASGIGRTFLTQGQVDFATRRVKPKSQSFAELIEPVWHELEWFDAYSVMRRAQSLLAKGDARLARAAEMMLEAFGIDAATLDAAIAEIDRFRPQFAQTFADMQTWRVSLLDYIRDSGGLTQEAYDWFTTMHDAYVPWERIYDNSEMTWQRTDFMGAAPRGQTVANVPSPFKALKGDYRPIASPTLGMVKQAFVITSAAERAWVGAAVADLLDPANPEHLPEPTRWGRKLPMPLRPVEFELEEIRKTLEAAFNMQQIPSPVLQEIAVIFRPDTAKALAGRENTLLITRHGKREVWEVDPDLHWAMLALGRGPVSKLFTNFVGSIVRVPTMLVRASFTRHPDFMVRAVLRDGLEIFLRTGQVPFVGFFRNLAAAVFKPSVYAQYVEELDLFGANYTIRTYEGRSHLFARAAASTLELLGFEERAAKMARKANPAWVNLKDAMERRKLATMTPLERAKLYGKMLVHPIQVLGIALDLTETPTRMASAQRRLASPFPEDVTERARRLRAGYEARRFPIEYDRAGPLLQTLGPVTAFMNASVEGVEAFFRDARKNPNRFVVSLAVFYLWSLLLRLWNTGDDERKEVHDRLEHWQEDTHWTLVLDKDHQYRFVKPYGFIGPINLFERFVLDWAYEHDPTAFDELTDALLEPYVPPLMPDLPAGLLEQYGNWMHFYERPVVTDAMARREDEFQYDEFTPEPFKWLGATYGLSPKRLEHIFRRYTGGLGRETMALGGILRRQVWDEIPDEPDSGIGDFPGLRAFTVRYPTFSAQPVQDFWRTYNEIQKHKNSLSFIRRQDPDRAERYVEQHPGVTRWAGQAERVADRLRRNRERRRRAWLDADMSGASKALELDALALDSIERAEDFLRHRRAFEAEINVGDRR